MLQKIFTPTEAALARHLGCDLEPADLADWEQQRLQKGK